MDIHQMQVRYDSTADRILWEVRTQGGEVLAAWITRRMALKFWPLYQGLVAQSALPGGLASAARASAATGTVTGSLPPGAAPAGPATTASPPTPSTPAPAAVTPPPLVTPEAREMLVQVARERPLAATEFGVPFNAQAVNRPLGADPLLPNAMDLGPNPNGRGIVFALREPGGRTMTLNMTPDMATALMRLLEPALRDADWGVPLAAPLVPDAAGGPPGPATPPRVLN